MIGRKVHFVLHDDVIEDLECLVPPEQRDRFVSEALRLQLVSLKRQAAFERIEELRRQGPSVSTGEIVQMLRAERDRLPV